MLCRMLCVMLFVAWTAEPSLEQDPFGMYSGYWRSPFQAFGPLFVSLPGIRLGTWQILLLSLTPLCLLRARAFRIGTWPTHAAILCSIASVGLTFLWGLVQGGSPYQAYFQLGRFLTGLLVGALLLAVIRNSADLKAVGATVLAAAVVRAALAIYFYFTYVRGQKLDPPPAYMTIHDDSLLFVAGLIVALCWAALGVKKGMGKIAMGLSIVALVVSLALNLRRLAWIELALAILAMYSVLSSRGLRRRVKRNLLLAAPVVAMYVAVGWGQPGIVFEPLRAFSTAGSFVDLSSLARQEEERNLLYTLDTYGNPILGIGWGQPYQKVSSRYANFGPEWWQYPFMPHNSLLGVAVFGGLVGLFGIWLVVPVAAYLGTRGYYAAPTAVDRAAALAAVGILPAYAAQCFGDIGFQSNTGALILGVVIAAAGCVFARARWSAAARRSRGLVDPAGSRPNALPRPDRGRFAVARGFARP